MGFLRLSVIDAILLVCLLAALAVALFEEPQIAKTNYEISQKALPPATLLIPLDEKGSE